jgi:hypothetical protein
VKRSALAYLSGLSVVLVAALGQAAPREGCQVEGVWCGPIVSGALAPERSHYFGVGLGVEGWGNKFSGSDYLVALATTLRVSAFAPYLQLMAKPDAGTSRYEEARLLFGPGLRAYFPLFGTQVSYGVGVLGELRFEEHFWLAYATPFELSGVLFRRHSFEVELFTGMRRAFAGKLVNSFLLDPNGFENEEAQANLDRATREEAWHGFVRIMISRRID